MNPAYLILGGWAVVTVWSIATLIWIAWTDCHPGESLWRAIARRHR